MFIARAPLFTLGLCLGGFICILPSSTATDLSTQENYPDGSFCTRCFLDSSTTDCSLAHFAYNTICPITGNACVGTYYPLDTSWQNIDSTGAIRDCVSSNKCVYYSYDYQNWGDWVSMQYCCFKPGSPYIDDWFKNGMTGDSQYVPQNIRPTTPSFEPQPTEGPGVGISCSLVQSASSAYNNAISLPNADTALVSYYAQALHMACLRSSPGCSISECSMVANVQKVISPACQGEDLGGEFEQNIFTGLVQGDSFSDVSGRQGKADSAINDLVQQINNQEIASPFLNFILSAGLSRDTKDLAQTYYSTIQVFDDLQPIMVEYLQQRVGDSDSESIKDTLNNVTRSHSQFMKCSVGASYFAQSQNSKSSTTASKATLPPAAAAAASFFVPVVAAQLRNDQLIKALESSSSLDLSTSSIKDLARYLQAQLPMSSALQFDTRNWVFSSPANSQGDAGSDSESAALLEQSFVKEEMSKKADSQVTLINELHTILELETSRDDQRLSDFMAASGLFFPTPDGHQAFQPLQISINGSSFTIVGPIGMVFPAASDFIPGMGTRSNASDPNSNESANPNGFAKGAGGGLEPVSPTDADIASVLYKSATLRLHIDPVHYMDAKPKINASQHFYILDLVSGQEISSKYTISSIGGDDRQGKPLEFGVLEAQLKFGQGIWAGGWSGGGAFAVGVKDWVASDGASLKEMWKNPIWGWVMGVIVLVDAI